MSETPILLMDDLLACLQLRLEKNVPLTLSAVEEMTERAERILTLMKQIRSRVDEICVVDGGDGMVSCLGYWPRQS